MTAPFKMITETELERYRYETWATKEPETVAWIEDMPDDAVFFDIGANVGVYSLLAAALHPSIRVYAFEPVIANYLRLWGNIRLNGFQDRITALPIAMSDDTGVGKISIPDARIAASGGQLGQAGDQDVLFADVQFLCDEFALPNPTHVKIDVDGIEPKILEGIGFIARQIQSLLVEFNEPYRNIVAQWEYMGFTVDNKYNLMENHSRARRKGLPENVILTRRD